MAQINVKKLIITDDHPMVIKGLKNMLADYVDIQVVATFTNGKDLLAALPEVQTDLILLDLMMPEMQGDEAVKKIVKLYPDFKSNHSVQSFRCHLCQQHDQSGCERLLDQNGGRSHIV